MKFIKKKKKKKKKKIYIIIIIIILINKYSRLYLSYLTKCSDFSDSV